MSRISSLTETTGLRSPHRAGDRGGGGAGAGAEQPDAHSASTISPAPIARCGHLKMEGKRITREFYVRTAMRHADHTRTRVAATPSATLQADRFSTRVGPGR